MNTIRGNAREQIREARQLIARARAPESTAIASLRCMQRAVKLMKPHFTANNPELGDAYVQLARARYAIWQMLQFLTSGARRFLLSQAIREMKAGVKVFEQGMNTDKLARLQLELASWLEQNGEHLKSALQFQTALYTIAEIRNSNLSQADVAGAANGFKHNALLAAAVEPDLPPLKFNAWRRTFCP